MKRFGLERANIIQKHLFKIKNRKFGYRVFHWFFLEACKKRMDASGLELNPSTVNFGKKRGLNIQNSDFLKQNLKKI